MACSNFPDELKESICPPWEDPDGLNPLPLQPLIKILQQVFLVILQVCQQLALFDPVDGFVYYGSLARFFRVNANFTGALNVNGPITTILNVGAGNLLNLVIDRTNGFQYIGR